MRFARVLVWAATAAGVARAQNAPHLAYALPAGGERGTTFEFTVGGQYLQNVTAVTISGAGVKATLGDHARPMNGGEAQRLRNRMQDLQKITALTEAQRAEMIDIRGKLLRFNAERFISPTLAETLKVQVTLDAKAATGNRELRVVSPQGLSNPLVFSVGALPEFTERETVETVPLAAGAPPNQTQIAQKPTDVEVTLPATINGRIKPLIGTTQQQNRAVQPFTPGDADRYRFQARRGQQLVFSVAARELVPYLADAVPGWFQAVLTLYGPDGREVAYDDDYRFHPDPVIHYAVPQDGEYAVEIRDSIYRGREDFVYRISIGELPFLTAMFPMGARTGAKTKVALDGWNLPVRTVTVDDRARLPGVYEVAAGESNALPFMVDALPEVAAKPGRNTAAHAQSIKLPVIVNGRVERPGEWTVFRFVGHAGQNVVAEVYARRMESPLDSVLRLTDAAGKQIAFNDDFEDKSAGLETHHADSRILTTLPANGNYYLYIGDVQGKGGPEYTYRLQVSAPRPDFEVRVTPSAMNLAAGMSTPVAVHAIRKDGFAGEIRVALQDAPQGFALGGAAIPAGQDEVKMTIAAPHGPRSPFALRFVAKAAIGGREVTHEAVPADNRMQAFFYWHLVTADETQATVRAAGQLVESARITTAGVVRIEAGAKSEVRVVVPLQPNSPIKKVDYELSDPPEGVMIANVSATPAGATLVLSCDAAKVKADLRGNLIVALTGEAPATANGRQTVRRVPLGVLPAIPFEIVAASGSAAVPDR
jgi:hypothetical protein